MGSGNQVFPWIHLDDACAVYVRAVEDDKMSGVYNVVAPDAVTNKQFTSAMGRTMNRPTFLWTPPFVLNAIFGRERLLFIFVIPIQKKFYR